MRFSRREIVRGKTFFENPSPAELQKGDTLVLSKEEAETGKLNIKVKGADKVITFAQMDKFLATKNLPPHSAPIATKNPDTFISFIGNNQVADFDENVFEVE